MYKFRWAHKIESSIDCFKEKYKNLPLFERILDTALIIAVLLTLVFLIVEHLFHISETWIQILHRFDIVLSIVFVADAVRTYKKSSHWTIFVKHHWLDVVSLLLVMLIFSSMLYPGAGRISYLLRSLKLHKVTKFYHLKHMDVVM